MSGLKKRLSYKMLVARVNAKHTRVQASVEIGCGISTIYELEKKGIEPKHPLIHKAVMDYIKKYKVRAPE